LDVRRTVAEALLEQNLLVHAINPKQLDRSRDSENTGVHAGTAPTSSSAGGFANSAATTTGRLVARQRSRRPANPSREDGNRKLDWQPLIAAILN
jgi:hypothetical protein